MWEIIDDEGTVHSGNEQEMLEAFSVMTNELDDDLSISDIRQLQHKWDCEWIGDLKLIEIHNTFR